MKTQMIRWALLGALAVTLNAGTAFASDDSSTPAAPGATPSSNTKDVQNTPGGPSEQVTASMPSGTKKHHKKKPQGMEPVANQAGDTTTKTPQADTAPATNTGTATPTSTP